MSEGMKAVVRNPILNKTSEFSSDPHFRHILGQTHSTFSMREAMDSGTIILVDLNRGLLGKHSATLGSSLMAQINSAVFGRKSRSIYSLYLDEIQNLLTADSDVDVLLAEARKFGISVVSANQYLDQFPKNMRSAIQAVGTHSHATWLSTMRTMTILEYQGEAETVVNRYRRELIRRLGVGNEDHSHDYLYEATRRHEMEDFKEIARDLRDLVKKLPEKPPQTDNHNFR